MAARLAAVAPANRMEGKALLTESEGSLRVQLARDNGTVVGERLLDARYPCNELADAAALVLASWQGEFDAAPVAAPELQTARSPRTGTGLELGFGLVAAGPRPLSAGGSLSIDVGKRRLGPRLPADRGGLPPPADRRGRDQLESIAGRLHGAPAVPVVQRPAALSLDAGVMAAALFARSQGLAMSHASSSFDFGPTVGAQVLFDAGSQFLPFLGISSAAWIQPHVIPVNATESRTLPKTDSWFVLGLLWRLDAR